MNKDIMIEVDEYKVICNVEYNGESLREEFNRFDIYDADGNSLAEKISVSEFHRIKTLVNVEITRMADDIVYEFEASKDEYQMFNLEESY